MKDLEFLRLLISKIHPISRFVTNRAYHMTYILFNL